MEIEKDGKIESGKLTIVGCYSVKKTEELAI